MATITIVRELRAYSTVGVYITNKYALLNFRSFVKAVILDKSLLSQKFGTYFLKSFSMGICPLRAVTFYPIPSSADGGKL